MIADSQRIFGAPEFSFRWTLARTHTAMERFFGIGRSRGETETVCVERIYTYVEQSAISSSYALTLIVYDPCTPAELLAFHLAAEAQTQDSIDNCALKNPEPSTTDSSRKCQRKRVRRGTRRKISKPIRTMSTEKHKGRRKQLKIYGHLYP